MEKRNRQVLQAQKKLYLGFSSEDNHSLILRKSTIRSILKKQPGRQYFEFPLSKEGVSYYGVIGRRLTIEAPIAPKRNFFLKTTQEKRFEQVIKKKKNFKEIIVQNHLLLRPGFVKNLKLLRNLRSLNVNLTLENFGEFVQVLVVLDCLQKLSINMLSAPGNASIEDSILKNVFPRFCRALASRKYLTSFRFWASKSLIFCNKRIEALFFGCLGNIDLPCFEIVIGTLKNDTLNTKHAEKFLRKVEFLSFGKTAPSEDVSQHKRLYFTCVLTNNCNEIVSFCSSLQRLDYEAFSEPLQSLGFASNIKEFFFVIPPFAMKIKGKAIEGLSKVLSEIPHLEQFTLTVPWQAKLNEHEQFRQIHLLLSQNQNLKHYNLKIFDHIQSIGVHPLEILCEELIKLQSLESLSLNFTGLHSRTPIDSILFPNLPKLKIFKLKTTAGDSSWEIFPMKSLSNMISVEELDIRVPKFDKPALLKDLPKLPAIRKLKISALENPKDGSDVLSFEDFQKKFELTEE